MKKELRERLRRLTASQVYDIRVRGIGRGRWRVAAAAAEEISRRVRPAAELADEIETAKLEAEACAHGGRLAGGRRLPFYLHPLPFCNEGG